MPEAYSHPDGGFIADFPDRIEVIVQARVKRGANPENLIAVDSVFKLAGQGLTSEEAQCSLADVLTAYIDSYRNRLPLHKVLSLWQRQELPEETIADMQRTFRERFGDAIRFVINKLEIN